MSQLQRKRKFSIIHLLLMVALIVFVSVGQTPNNSHGTQDKKQRADALLYEAKILARQGTAESMGDSSEKLEQALKLFQELNDKPKEITCFFELGDNHKKAGELQKALNYYEQALSISKLIGDKEEEANGLSRIGYLYSDLGEVRRALDYYHQALSAYKAVGNSTFEKALSDLISAVNERLESEEQLEISKRKLEELEKELANKKKGNNDHNQLESPSDKSNRSNEPDEISNRLNRKLINIYLQELPLAKELNGSYGEANVLTNLGEAYLALNEKPTALDYFNQALLQHKRAGNKLGEAKTAYLLKNIWELMNNPRIAVYYGKQAINTLQQLRSNIKGLGKETQQAFLKSVEERYRFLADILIAQGRIPEAEQVLAMLKDEELFQFVRRDSDIVEMLRQRADLNEMETKALSEYNKYSDRLTEIGNRLSELDKKRKKFPADNFPQQAEYDQLKLQLEDARRVFIVFLRQLAEEFGKSNEKVRQIESSLQADLKRWNANNVIVISTIAGEERLNLIITTSTTQKAYTIEIKAANLNKLVQDFRSVINDPSTKYDPRPLGHRLYNLLMKPLEKDLAGAKTDTLLWSLDGTLRYVPMAALWDGKRYLAERYRNVIITLASRSKIGEALAANKSDWQALGAGVSAKWPGFTELPAVPEELRSIVSEAAAQNPDKEIGVLRGERLLDAQFTLRSFERSLGRYRLIHIASHFSFRPGDETNSFLLLGDGNRLTVDKVRAADSMFDSVELLALSACDTAAGGTGANGAEVESFGVIAQEQGAKAVMGTLWPVADASTRDLMVAFYRAYSTNPKLNKAEALRQSQLLLLHGARTKTRTKGGDPRADIVMGTPGNGPQPLFQKDLSNPFAHPYYWAPFVLIGNWR